MSTPRRSAAVILHREGPSGLEVYLVERSPRLRFLGGHLAFPGGAVEAGDGDIPLRPAVDGAVEDRELLGCAARELLEETGISALLDGGGSRGAAPGELERLRDQLRRDDSQAAGFARFLAERGLSVDASRFRPVSRLVTPRFSPLRYDTTYYLLAPGREPAVLPGELVSGAWRRPAEALDEWSGGKLLVAPPVVDILEVLAAGPLDRALEELRAIPAEFEGSGRAVRCAPGYEVIPLETPPLPEDIPTNAFLVGREHFVLVDPAPRRGKQQEHLFAAIDRRLAAGERLAGIVLTHHHPDHVGALDAALARHRAPLWAHAVTGGLLGRKLDRELSDGAVIDLGLGPRGSGGPRGGIARSLRVLFTPGHAEGHIALHDEESRSLIAGDLVSTLVSMYVGSPGGNLRQYFASLERLRGLGVETLYPSHGAPTREPVKLIDETLRHRKARIEEVRARLGAEPRETESLALEIYPEASGKLRLLVVRTTRASLEHLVEEGRAERCGPDAFRQR